MKLLAEYSLPEQTALRTTVCPEATDDQINYFLRVCHARSVDPFSGLLYMQLRQSKGKVKAGVSPTIDGARAAASRTGYYAGSDEAEYDAETERYPKWCRVTVYRMNKSERCAYTAKCRWEEFKPKPPNDFQWNDRPYHMLAKCTEMQALRKAFPELVSGANEEDYEVETEPTPVDQAKQAEAARLAVEWSNAVKAFEPLGKKEADMLAMLGVTRGDLTGEHMDILRQKYEEFIREREAHS